MLRKIPNGFQSLHFYILTLSPTRANWVKRWSKVQVISFIGHVMWVSYTRDGNMQLGGVHDGLLKSSIMGQNK
jgi:hypothetical protein